jgi:hypothetical protein
MFEAVVSFVVEVKSKYKGPAFMSGLYNRKMLVFVLWDLGTIF